MSKYIIYQPWGGLGDNLQYSTLPEICYYHGIDCYISNKNVYNNNEIKELVWDYNPYIKGYSSKGSNAGECKYKGNHDGATSIIDAQEGWHNLGLHNHLPIIYYHPALLANFKNKILIDFSAITRNNDYDKELILKYINNLNKENTLFITSKKKDFNYIGLDLIDRYEFNDIFEYTNLIYSCKKFICLYSGSSVLAAAIGRFRANIDIDCYLPGNEVPDFQASYYYFNNINYKNFTSIC